MTDMFFESWSSLLRMMVLGVSSYAALVLILRTTGKRTVSKWNSFDMVITVSLGSSTATLILTR